MIYNLHGDICDWQFDELTNVLQNNQGKDVVIDIDSYGGNLRSGWKMYDLIRTHEGNVFVNVSGECMSAAVLPLLACKAENRSANKLAQFMIHKPLLGWFGALEDEDCVSIHEQIQKETAKLKNTYLERTTASDKELDVMIDSQQEFGTDLALNLGFIDHTNEYINKKINKEMKESSIERALRNLLVKVGMLNQKEFTTADGGTLVVETDDLIKVGDETPNEDGVYLMPDGAKVIIEKGKVTSVENASTEDPEKKEDETQTEDPEKKDDETQTEDPEKKEDEEEKKKDEEIKNLKEKITELQDKADSYDRMSALVNKCGGEDALQSLLNARSAESPKKSSQSSEENLYDRFKSL